MKRISFLLTLIFLAFASCDTAKQQIQGMYNMINCDYSYQSLNNISIAGINASNGISLANIPKVTSILAGTATSIPLDFTINLNVANNGTSAALLSALNYTITIDNIQFTKGALTENFEVPAASSRTLPLTVSLDLKTLLSGESKNSALGIVKNLLGMGTQESKVSLSLTPSYNLGSTKIISPIPIKVDFAFGKK